MQRGQLFEGFHQVVQTHPNRIALHVNGEEFTFEQLQKEAESLGQHIRASLPNFNGILTLSVDRSLQSALAIFSCLYAGIAFSVLDEDIPEARAEFMLERLGIEPLIWDVRGANLYPNLQRFHLTKEKVEIPNLDEHSLALVLMTSGSTGVPKGVAHTRFSAYRHLNNHLDVPVENARLISITPFAFAGGLINVMRVGSGKSYFNISPNRWSLQSLLEHFRELEPTHLYLPSQFARLIAKVPAINPQINAIEVNVGGDSTTYEVLQGVSKHFSDETTYQHFLAASEGSRPLSFLGVKEDLNKSGAVRMSVHPRTNPSKLVPQSDFEEEIFEVWVGDHVAAGYYNNTEMTEERFIEEDGMRWWKSGDLVKRVGDNEFIHFGRKDDVVKISGYLVSPASISSVLATMPGVQQAVVLPHEIGGRKILVANIEATNPEELTPEMVIAFLQEQLPHYMIPGQIQIMEKLPINSRGKVNRAELSKREQQ